MGRQIRLFVKKNEKGFGVPKIKGRIHCDEKYVKVKDHWEFELTAIDNITKFVLAEDLVVERTIAACVSFLRADKNLVLRPDIGTLSKRASEASEEKAPYYLRLG